MHRHACHSDVSPNRQIPPWADQNKLCGFWEKDWHREEAKHCKGCLYGPGKEEEKE